MYVEKVLEDQGLEYKDSGDDLLIKCLSPEHTDATPSLRVDKDIGLMHCFSCGFKGNLFNFFNIERDLVDDAVYRTKDRIRSLRFNTEGYKIPENPIPIQEKEIRGIPKKLLNDMGVFTHPDFGNRYCFPVYDGVGICRYLITRDKDKTSKFRYVVYPKGHDNSMLYPSRITPIDNSIIWVEGIFDMLSLMRGGTNNIQCLQGVSTVTEKTAKDKLVYIDIMGIRKVYLMMDNDEAGERAAENLSELIRKFTQATPVVLRYSGDDPGELTEKQVINLLKKLYGESYGV